MSATCAKDASLRSILSLVPAILTAVGRDVIRYSILSPTYRTRSAVELKVIGCSSTARLSAAVMPMSGAPRTCERHHHLEGNTQTLCVVSCVDSDNVLDLQSDDSS